VVGPARPDISPRSLHALFRSWANLAFVALSLPLITLPAAYSALQRVGHLAHTDPSEANLSAFWETFRANLIRALPWGLANALFRSEEHTSELQSREKLVCRLL